MSQLLSTAGRFASDSMKQSINGVLKKFGVDAKLQFSLDPPNTETGYQQWLNAMKAVSRLPDGIPNHFRRKLWVTLANHHIQTLGIDWEETCKAAFNDRLNPDDDKLGMQIIKDLHRTGWTGLNGEQARIQLKRVLLAYARYNKNIGYCQGFNVIAALVLEITEFKEEMAFKIMIFLIEQVLPSGYFDQTLRALSVDMAVLRDLLHQRLPKMAGHLDNLQKNSESEYEPPLTNVFSMQWFLTLFATCLPKTCVYRLWDALMLDGSEILLRTSLAIWAKISRRVLRTQSADEFYGLMGSLCQRLLQMGPAEANDLMQVVYTMAEFPYPGVAELRERYTWNIQPFSSTFKLLRQQVSSILNSDVDDNSDTDSTITPSCSLGVVPGGEKLCASARGTISVPDLNSLQKQYKLMKKRQKQAAIILQTAYERGQNRLTPNSAKYSSAFGGGQSPTAFNHLYVGQGNGQSGGTPSFVTMSGTVPLSSKAIQPSSAVRRSRPSRQLIDASENVTSEREGALSPQLSPDTPDCLADEAELWSPRRQRSHSFDSWLMGRERAESADLKASRRWSSLGDLRFAGQLRHRPPIISIMQSRKKKSAPPPDVLYRERKASLVSDSGVHSQSPIKSSHTVIACDLQNTNAAISGGQDESALRKKSAKAAAMLSKSKAMLDAIASQPIRPTFNPFPTRHRTTLIEREKKLGLW
uniref:Rab-GAP TBC domain-containing protein n=1 Tax=Plectus sambesii TaxID=2011161 RepID=A0A914W0D4_9BILA